MSKLRYWLLEISKKNTDGEKLYFFISQTIIITIAF